MNRLFKNKAFVLAFVCAIVVLPFLGLAEFNTKGEPREAVVAYSILQSGDWILPTNNGGEIPYKPPFFHWCIAVASMLNGGIVNEFTSRLPSALALIAMTVGCYTFYARRRNALQALATALVAFTTFELHRAGANCRVDMLLTAATVGALFMLYRWWETGMKRIPWFAIILMSIGTLTKGPVGTIVPCLCMGIFMLLRGVNFFKAFFSLTAWGILSLILPALWYIAAYFQGEQEFLDLVMEENFGRMTSTMSYESCVNPWTYNIVTLVAGFIPWTLAIVIALFVLPYRHFKRPKEADSWPALFKLFKTLPPVNLFSAVSAITIFVFYCIPQSKRSVYLMPMYPFVAYFVVMLLSWIQRQRPNIVKILGDIMSCAAILLTLCFFVVKCGFVPDAIFGNGRHAATNAAMLHAIADINGFWPLLWAAVAPIAAIAWWAKYRRRVSDNRATIAVSAIIMAIYIALSGAYQPAVLNVKSVKNVAADIDTIAPIEKGQLYEFIAQGEFAKGDPVHYFEVNFYLGNRMASFYKNRPKSGFLLIGDDDATIYFEEFHSLGYSFEEVYEAPKPLLGQHTRLYKFTKS